MEARLPKPQTLARYGLTADEWRAILDQQGGVCFVCERLPESGRLCVDHEHEKGWKKKPAEQRKRAVRGLLCFRCNSTFVSRGATARKSRRVAEYLEAYALRRMLDTQAPAGS